MTKSFHLLRSSSLLTVLRTNSQSAGWGRGVLRMRSFSSTLSSSLSSLQSSREDNNKNNKSPSRRRTEKNMMMILRRLHNDVLEDNERLRIQESNASQRIPDGSTMMTSISSSSSSPNTITNNEVTPASDHATPFERSVTTDEKKNKPQHLPAVHHEEGDYHLTTPPISVLIQSLVDAIQKGVETVQRGDIVETRTGEQQQQQQQHRVFSLQALPKVSREDYNENSRQTALWLYQHLVTNTTESLSSSSSSSIILYVGFEAFDDRNFVPALAALAQQSPHTRLVFSSLVKSTRHYMQHKTYYEAMEEESISSSNNNDVVLSDPNTMIVHLGASHAMDHLLFPEDPKGYLQDAWTQGRLVLLSPELFVVDQLAFRAGLSPCLQYIVDATAAAAADKSTTTTSNSHEGADGGSDSPSGGSETLVEPERSYRVLPTRPCDYIQLDKDIQATKERVESATTMEQVFAEFYSLITTYTEQGQLSSPCYWDSGWESFHMYKAVSQALEAEGKRLPWTKLGLINARNAAIGDSLHAFYATCPESFPIVVCGDTAALLAGGISMINTHTRNRFGVVIVTNNRGMAIEDVISKRSVDGHQYQYDYVKLDQKRDIFTLDHLKEVVKTEVLAALRDHLWGVSANRAEAIVLNIDVQSLRKENANKAPTDAILLGSSFLHEDFGERFRHLEKPRKRLEAIVNVLYDERNKGEAKNSGAQVPVKIQGCSAIEFMEILSQLTITLRNKIIFLPTPTDLLATRTLLPSLVEARFRTTHSPHSVSNFWNSNGNFSVFISNTIFGVDGLNNLISTHLEYGTGCLVHLAYDAADRVSHYSLIGQVHRNFGIRPSALLPGLYQTHEAYKGQVVYIKIDDEDAMTQLQTGIRDPSVKAILVDMGAPNLTSGLTAE